MNLKPSLEYQLKYPEGNGEHDAAGQDDAAEDGLNSLFIVEVEQGSGERAGPDAGAR